MPIEIVENELKSSEVPINYAQVAGSGPPIVLLHWASGSRQRWSKRIWSHSAPSVTSTHRTRAATESRAGRRDAIASSTTPAMSACAASEALLSDVVRQPRRLDSKATPMTTPSALAACQISSAKSSSTHR